jgi:ABC-type lipoprotein export system ATPase subunit
MTGGDATARGPASVPVELVRLRGVGLEVSRPVATRILYPVDLDVPRGSSLAVVGPSGAGKSTLASIVGGLQPASEGSYLFDGREVCGLSGDEMARFRNDHVGFVFQNAHLIDERRAWQNVALGLTDPTVPASLVEARSRRALAGVGLAYVADREAALLSGGERQRVAVARAVVKNPDLIIADEPTGALDQGTGQAILGLLYSLTGSGATLIIVTHDERAAGPADRCVTVVDGRLDG